MQNTITIQPGQSYIDNSGGKVLSVKNSTLPLVGSFNSGVPFTMLAGNAYNVGEPEFRTVQFVNPQAVAVTVTYHIGESAVAFFPQDNQQKIAATYAKGTYISAGALPTVAAITSSPPGSPTAIPGTNNGHIRKSITFSTSSTTATDRVIIADLSNNKFCVLTNVTPLVFETNADFVAWSIGSPDLIIGEIYYSN